MYNTLTFICRKFTNGYQNWLTKEECIQTFVWHVFIDQHFFFSFNTATKEPNKIPMLKFRNYHHLIHKLLWPLSRGFRKSFYCNLLSIQQFPYKQTSKSWLDIQIIRQESSSRVTITLYTIPNPPSPSLLDRWKLFVALASSLKLNSSSS